MAVPPIADPYATLTASVQDDQSNDPHLTYNPYPDSIRQSVISPLGEQRQAATPPALVAPVIPEPEPVQPIVQQIPPPATSEKVVSPDIINLANNSDLSIETIAHEAQRIHQKEQQLPEDEVVISLR
jgi:hypothetical protein